MTNETHVKWTTMYIDTFEGEDKLELFIYLDDQFRLDLYLYLFLIFHKF